MHNNDLNHEILKLIKEQPEISEKISPHSFNFGDAVKARIASLKDIREKNPDYGNGHNDFHDLKKALEAENYNVVNVSNTLPVLKAISEEKPDLVLLDTASLDKDGFEICRQLKASPKCWWVPIMMLSENIKWKTALKPSSLELMTILLHLLILLN
jgi:hypothetical protein